MAIIFEDDFKGGVKPEWKVLQGSWAYDSALEAYKTTGSLKNTVNVDYSIPDDNYVELKIINVDLANTYIYLLTRSNWESSFPNSGYAICYNKIYSDYYGIAFYLTYYVDGSQKDADPVFITWDELEGFNDITDLEGHTIGIKCKGNFVTGYLDGKEILSKPYTYYTSGTASIIVNKADFIFDDFKIDDLKEDVVKKLGVFAVLSTARGHSLKREVEEGEWLKLIGS